MIRGTEDDRAGRWALSFPGTVDGYPARSVRRPASAAASPARSRRSTGRRPGSGFHPARARRLPSFRIFASPRLVRFTEMEYGSRARRGRGRARRARVLERARGLVPLEFRLVAADDALPHPPTAATAPTSPCTCSRAWSGSRFPGGRVDDELLGGRPHWGKWHFLRAAELAPRYPDWERSRPCARSSIPTGVFENDTPSRRPEPRGTSALAAVGRDRRHDLAARDQVHHVEALAQLARLGVAEPHAVADPQRRGGRAEQRRLHLAGALAARRAAGPAGRRGAGSRSRPAAPEAR